MMKKAAAAMSQFQAPNETRYSMIMTLPAQAGGE
jgi:hypothetical protein